ncbi:MAG: CAP domain-containing protein [Dethiobacteria bacterium]|jgi:uncharacterized protein YkwD
MKKNKIVLLFTLIVFLSVFLLPVNSVGAVGGIIAREGFQVAPSTGDHKWSSPGTYKPVPPASSQPGTGQTADGALQINNYTPFDRTSRRGGGFYVPPATPSNPITQPSPSTPPPSSPANPPPSIQNPAAPEEPSWLTADELKALALLNEFRIKNGISPLQVDINLTRVARLKAQDIIDNNYFAHVSPTYGTIGQMLRNGGISFNKAGENLSKAGNVNQAHLQLEYSTQGHRENMLNSSYKYVGIGILKLQKTPGIIMVQLFTN